MISELYIDDPNRSCVLHWSQVDGLAGRSRIDFKPGLNILWGPNGSGKSTILTALARMLHCEQGGRTTVTRDSVCAVFRVAGTGAMSRVGDRTDRLADGVRPIHDGQCVLHFDPGHAVGLMGGGYAFDWDFGMEGISNAMFRGSAGETVMQRITEVLQAIVEPNKWPAANWKLIRPEGEPKPERDPWDAQLRQVDAFLKGTLERSQPTVLLDEPDRSLAMGLQVGLWQNLAKRYCREVQIIAASHSPLALRLPGVNYIDIVPGYLAECEGVVDRFIRDLPVPPKEAAKPKRKRAGRGVATE